MIIGRRSTMVDRYLDGTLAGDELQKFLRRLAHDSKLRGLLEEEQSIRYAISRDKAAIPILSEEFPEHLHNLMIANPAPEGGPLDKGGKGGGRLPGAGVVAGKGGSSLLRILSTSFAVLVVLLSIFYMIGLLDLQPSQEQTEPGQAGSQANDPAKPARSDKLVDPQETTVKAQPSEQVPSAGSNNQSPTIGPTDTPLSRTRAQAKPKADNNQKIGEPILSDEERMRNSLDKEERAADVPLVRRDSSVRMNVKLDKH